MSKVLFKDRAEAGRRLAAALSEFKGQDVVVLAIPRGGVAVGSEVAGVLGAPLDVVVTRKIEAPGEPEYALGAVTQEGEVIMDRQAAESLGATKEYLDSQVRKKKAEVEERVRKFRGDRKFPVLEGKTVIIVDDGIATGSSVGAAVMSVKKRSPKMLVVAVPVAPPDAVETLSEDVDRVVCLERPTEFLSIGEFFGNFDQVEDEDVKRILEDGWARRG
ncbi:MAG: phosphoribosyltransferase [archaeon]|nr:MAG: phosphoribosyltransferase [archaeon]